MVLVTGATVAPLLTATAPLLNVNAWPLSSNTVYK
jgi:hypothetical protein